MIDLQQAEKIADEHIASLNDPAPGYRYSRAKGVVVDSGWYFDYKILCNLNIPEEEQELFLGAFGFVVDKQTGHVRPVSAGAYADLGLSNNNDPNED